MTAELLILLANIAVFALSLKLYTEFFKQRAQDQRQNKLAQIEGAK